MITVEANNKHLLFALSCNFSIMRDSFERVTQGKQHVRSY